MEQSVRGRIIVVRFPFTNMKESKKRPALVVRQNVWNDYTILPITSQSHPQSAQYELHAHLIQNGKLSKPVSYIQCEKPITISKHVVEKVVGTLRNDAFEQVVETLVAYITGCTRAR